MAAEHLKEQYVGQIEESSHAFQTAVKSLHELGKKPGKDSKEWKTQLSKSEVQLEHFQILVKGFDDEFKKKFKEKIAPDDMLKLQERVKKQNVAVNFIKASMKK